MSEAVEGGQEPCMLCAMEYAGEVGTSKEGGRKKNPSTLLQQLQDGWITQWLGAFAALAEDQHA